MAFSTSLPVSEIIKSQDNNEPKKKSREDWRKAKELEEARKLGTAPAAVDEEGKDINPHIPQYISQAPWYFGSAGQATLKHQRPQEEKQRQFSSLDEWYKRGTNNDASATRYRKGACENCGAMTHKKKDCLDRPRRIGAKFSGSNIKPDESLQPDLSFDYDGKRDRWNGYDPDNHKAIIEEYSKVEEAKRQLKADKLISDADAEVPESSKPQADAESDEEDDEDKYADDFDMPGTKVDSKQRITVRNLRIREDTAKYLRNLDPNSAYYDPKTRSMRENPYKGTGKTNEEVQFAGENFVRYTGDTTAHAKAQLFAWDAYNKGVDVHVLAEPTKLELLKGEFENKKDDFKQTVKSTVLEKYGGIEHLEAPPRELIFAQTEDYVEYSKRGKVIKGEEKQICRSKYEEDVYPSNHMSVWGSYWSKGSWGYQCCHSTVKNSYCTGEAGREANQQDSALTNLANESGQQEETSQPDGEEEEEEEPKTLLEEHQEKINLKKLKKRQKKKMKKLKKRERKLKRKQKEQESSSSSESESNDAEIDQEKLKKALIAESKSQETGELLLKTEERKRAYNSMFEVKEPSKEEMEAFMMKRKRTDDPMAQFLD